MELKKKFGLLTLIVLAICATPCFGIVSGTVTETTGKAVSGASVTFTDEANSARSISAVTDIDGKYRIDFTTSVNDAFGATATPKVFSLGQNYPNPFNPSTIVPYSLVQAGLLDLTIYNVQGQKIRTLIDGHSSAGQHFATWDGVDDRGNAVSAGVYLYQLRVGNRTETKKMLLLDGGDSHGAMNSMVSGAQVSAKIVSESKYTITITHSGIIPYEKTGVIITDGQTMDFVVSLKEALKEAIIIDHACAKLDSIPDEWITKAKETLRIAYGHTSHGSQLVTGMTGLVGFKGAKYSFKAGGAGGTLDLRDTPFKDAYDLGNPDFTAWAAATRTYLTATPEVNVVMWSWCGEVSGATSANIDTYLSLMSGLEKDFPKVRFVYMTGHLDGSGLTGNLHKRNEQIREYCRTNNNKALYDFNDIESWNPDGVWFGDKFPTDNCDYTDGSKTGNWAIEWQNTHQKGVDWYECDAAHSQSLNANCKAYAAWWLFARLAGWK